MVPSTIFVVTLIGLPIYRRHTYRRHAAFPSLRLGVFARCILFFKQSGHKVGRLTWGRLGAETCLRKAGAKEGNLVFSLPAQAGLSLLGT
jgi:hypothetical protein